MIDLIQIEAIHFLPSIRTMAYLIASSVVSFSFSIENTNKGIKEVIIKMPIIMTSPILTPAFLKISLTISG